MRNYLTTWTKRKALGAVLPLIFLGAGIFAVLWEPEQSARGSLVLGDATAPVVVTELADFT